MSNDPLIDDAESTDEARPKKDLMRSRSGKILYGLLFLGWVGVVTKYAIEHPESRAFILISNPPLLLAGIWGMYRPDKNHSRY